MEFHWYQRKPWLLEQEINVMNAKFPQYQLVKKADGRLYWFGHLTPGLLEFGATYYTKMTYSSTHPCQDSFGGSVRHRLWKPTLEELQRELGPIPHLLRDSEGLYICTARIEDFKVGCVSSSAASTLAWTAKWLNSLELWLQGELSTEEFAGHNI